MHQPLRFLVGAGLAVGLAACAEVTTDPGGPVVVRPELAVIDPTPVAGQALLCKIGTAAAFDVTVGGSTTTYLLNPGDCITIATAVIIPGQPTPPIVVSVNETVTPGIVIDSVTLDSVDVRGNMTHAVFTGTSSLTSGIDDDNGITITFYNTEAPLLNGRMTGGGGPTTLAGASITGGFTVHCDIILSNNLELNWGKNNWHLDKPLTSALCIDDPAINPKPPAAPFDTFIGEGIGTLNGVDGSLVKFVFVDAGEPGTNDKAKIQIFAPGGALVLDVPLTVISKGNFQAHFDQPHK